MFGIKPPKLRHISNLARELEKNPDHASNITGIVETALDALEELGKYDEEYGKYAEEYIAKALERIGSERRLSSLHKKLAERFVLTYKKLGGGDKEKEGEKVRIGYLGVFADIRMALDAWGRDSSKSHEFLEKSEADKWYEKLCKDNKINS